uniref:DUF8204 domain-containing protein n=1 Tax=Oryza punctata TaxID=4537 RepID=A0A0E0M3R6_ORYPU
MGVESPASGGGAAAAAGKPLGSALPRRGKSCKGCLYYSSMLRSRGFNPVCVGIPRSIPQVPSYVVDEPREEAAAQGHDLRQFKYACAGYSMFVVDNKDGRGGEKEGKTLLPYCQGLELPPALGNKDKYPGNLEDMISMRGKLAFIFSLLYEVAAGLGRVQDWSLQALQRI